uniref:Uncharacterized protein n=1 Tax=Rhizophora mucronata TaxID=61149 RepID=A0A2P2PPH5_RHIMU
MLKDIQCVLCSLKIDKFRLSTEDSIAFKYLPWILVHRLSTFLEIL